MRPGSLLVAILAVAGVLTFSAAPMNVLRAPGKTSRRQLKRTEDRS